MRTLSAVVAASLLFVASGAPRPLAAASAPPAVHPKLVVVVVVDQMRGDYPIRYASLLSKGLKRLTTEGAWFQKAAYPYFETVTCVGHSTIGTGALPYAHGMIQNVYYDRALGRAVPCTADPDVNDVSVGDPAPASAPKTSAGRFGDSASRMQVPAFAEAVHTALHGHVVTLSLKARSAIGLAGHAGDAVIWMDGRGNWQTSTAYHAAPPAWVDAFERANPVSGDAGKTWERALPEDRYQYSDEPAGEHPGAGWSAAFPHPLGNFVDRTFISRWEMSPYADDELEKLAEAAVDAEHLGHNDGTDFLGVSFSSTDLVGHAFGPRSHEVQDMYERLDATLGRFLAYLDEKVGAGNYVLALSADHGVADVPEQVPGAGRIVVPHMTAEVEQALQGSFGDDKYVAANIGSEIYFKPGVYDRLTKDAAAMKRVTDAILGVAGVARVIRSDEISTAAARHSTDPILRAAALSYYPGRSGDLLVVPKEGWIATTTTATHGSPYAYDQHVPVIFFGAGIKPGIRMDPATPADIAATLGAIVGVHAGGADSHVLASALAPGVAMPPHSR